MKRILVIILSLTLLLACVPTPEQDAVKQKDTNVLIDTVRTENEAQQNAGTELPPVKAQFPERFQCDFTTSAQNVHVVADVPIEVLTDGAFPTLRVERRILTDNERMTVARRVFGTDELYVFEQQITREQLEEMIRVYMHEPTPDEKAAWMRDIGGSEEEWQRKEERRKETLQDLQRQYNALPDDDTPVPLLRWDGTLSPLEGNALNRFELVTDPMPGEGLYQRNHLTVYPDDVDRPMDYCVAWRNDRDVTWARFFDGSHKFGAERIDPKDYDTPHEGASVTPNDAIKLVQDLFDGVADLIPADVYWANNAATDGEDVGVSSNTRWAYFIHFSQNFNGAYAPYCSGMAFERNEDAGYASLWFYETLMAAVDREGNLICFDWFAPLKVTDTIAESTPLLPYAEIQRIFEAQMNLKFGYEGAKDGALKLDRVQLGLFRIREQNDMEHGLMVPVWFFTGVFEYSEETAAERLKEGLGPEQAKCDYKDEQNPLCIINAVDGTIIDPMKGY